MSEYMPRLDVFLLEGGYFASRQKAREAIISGLVSVGGKTVLKPGAVVARNALIEICGECCHYVGRGGLKLEHALKCFGVDVRDKVALDIGASTGGFTDCLLSYGAKLVYAVDVGHGQMDAALAANE
jgi:23S rRNA (cytidine1920-2'-O)/16S rRNA (cytidine1409-2'-O)-methyltransferase